MSISSSTACCQLRIASDLRVCEFIGFAFPMADTHGLPVTPGVTEFDAQGELRAAHVAPSRWLLPVPSDATGTFLTSLADRKLGVVCDVTGKWSRVAISGRDAGRILANSVDLDMLFRDRDAATTTVFDCPVILVEGVADYIAWVPRSLLASFVTALCALGATV